MSTLSTLIPLVVIILKIVLMFMERKKDYDKQKEISNLQEAIANNDLNSLAVILARLPKG